MSRTSTATWKRTRDATKAKAQAQGQWACPLCGQPIDWLYAGHPNSPEVDHIIPYAKGGTDTPENLRVICRTCNRTRGGAQGNRARRERETTATVQPVTPPTRVKW